MVTKVRKSTAKRGTAERPVRLDETVDRVPFGSKEHEQLIAIGYDGMTVAEAKKIVKERDEKPELWPWEEYKKAQAVIEANASTPIVVATRQGWKRGN